MASSGGLTSFSFNSNTLSVIAGDTGSLTLTIDCADLSSEIDKTTITFTSSNTSIATVAPATTKIQYSTHSYLITITGASAGSSTITAACTDSQGTAWTSTATVTVTNPTQVIVAEQSLQDIADSIRTKLGTSDTYLPSEMSAAIDSISTGGNNNLLGYTEKKYVLDPSNLGNAMIYTIEESYSQSVHNYGQYVFVGIPSDSSNSNTANFAEYIRPPKPAILNTTSGGQHYLTYYVYFNKPLQTPITISLYSANVFHFYGQGGLQEHEWDYARFMTMFLLAPDFSAALSGVAESNSDSYDVVRTYVLDLLKNTTSKINVEDVERLYNYAVGNGKVVNRTLKSLLADSSTSSTASSLVTSILNDLGCTNISVTSSSISYTLPNNETRTFASTDMPVFQAFITRAHPDTMQAIFNKLKSEYSSITNPKTCGVDSFWNYDSSATTVLIDGTGVSYGVLPINSSGANDSIYADAKNATSCVVGPDISYLAGGSCRTPSNTITNWVFMQQANDTIVLESDWFQNPKQASDPKPVFEIYTDNLSIRNYSFSSNITVNFHSLSEWEGPLVS